MHNNRINTPSSSHTRSIADHPICPERTCAAAAQPQVAGPNVPFSGGVRSGSAFQSAVFWYTVLPHHVWMLFAPIVPLRGYCRQKKITTTDTATPASRPADRTSEQS